jgi:type IV pilus assembly protein PilM
MALFSKPISYLGVDFDSNSIKIVELCNENRRSKLVTYGYVDKSIDIIPNENDLPNDEETAKLIREVCKQAKTTTTQAVTALPAFSVFSSILTLPDMPKKDLLSAVNWEAKKVVPMPLAEMVLDWKILENLSIVGQETESRPVQSADSYQAPDQTNENSTINPKAARKYLKILLTAAPKDLVKRYIDIFRLAGLNLLSLDTETFALIRSLVGNDKSPLMIVDIGSAVTTICVVTNGVPVFARSIDIGGLTITKAVANSLNVSLSRAEQFKYDIGMSQRRLGQGSIPKTIEMTLTPIIDELKYSLNLYQNQGQKEIEKIIITGGSALLLNLAEYFANLLSLRVFIGDPWARVIYPNELKPVLDEIGPRYSVAIGLAMRDIE